MSKQDDDGGFATLSSPDNVGPYLGDAEFVRQQLAACYNDVLTARPTSAALDASICKYADVFTGATGVRCISAWWNKETGLGEFLAEQRGYPWSGDTLSVVKLFLADYLREMAAVARSHTGEDASAYADEQNDIIIEHTGLLLGLVPYVAT